VTRKSFLVAVAITVSAAAMTIAAAQGRIPGRLLAVFEDATGQPVAGAEVADLATNTRAVTSASGAISLAGPGAGTTILPIRTIGYAALIVPVAISAADTNSITVVLKPLTQTLPVVVGLVTRPLRRGKYSHCGGLSPLPWFVIGVALAALGIIGYAVFARVAASRVAGSRAQDGA
jgi:hypothetical protein